MVDIVHMRLRRRACPQKDEPVAAVALLRKCGCADYRIDTVRGSVQSVIDGSGDR